MTVVSTTGADRHTPNQRPTAPVPDVTDRVDHRRATPAGLFTHPVVVGSLGLLIGNDHVLKAAFHNTFTGKLSDIAGLVFFPVLLVSIVEVVAWMTGRLTPSRTRMLLITGLLTALGFAGIQTMEPATDLYRSVAGLLTGRQTMVVADSTDLIALPGCFVGWCLERRLTRRRR